MKMIVNMVNSPKSSIKKLSGAKYYSLINPISLSFFYEKNLIKDFAFYAQHIIA